MSSKKRRPPPKRPTPRRPGRANPTRAARPTPSPKLKRSRRARLKAAAGRLRAVKDMRLRDGGEALKGVTTGLWGRARLRFQALWEWYLAHSLIARALWGLLLLPILALFIALNFVLIPLITPFLPIIGGLLLTALKLAFVVGKLGAFAVYIGYKVFKTLLGLYYCVSRTLSGNAAGRARRALAGVGLPLSQAALEARSPHHGAHAHRAPRELHHPRGALSARVAWKRLWLTSEAEGISHPLLFSYLRYFLLGQRHMYLEGWRARGAFLTAWRPESRARIKAVFAFVGSTIFRPHAMGPRLTRDEALLPGDARLVSALLTAEGVRYAVEVPWRAWSLSRRWPFAQSALHVARWRVTLPLSLASLSDEALGWRPEQVVSEGGAGGADALEDALEGLAEG